MTDAFVVFSTNLVQSVGKEGWRVEVYTQKCLKFLSETIVKLPLFLSSLVFRIFIIKIFLEKQKVCMHTYMKLLTSNMNKQESLIT